MEVELNSTSIEEFYESLVSTTQNPHDVVKYIGDDATLENMSSDILIPDFNETISGSEIMMWRDIHTYLPGDILSKVDRASMACGLEVRTPFLDHNLFELAWGLPLNKKIRGGKGKWIARSILDRYVPNSLIEGPKKGFGVPISSLLRGGLKPWAEALLDFQKIEAEGYLKSEFIRVKWMEHLSKKADHGPFLWSVLMFELWLGSSA